jgi:hypothetical protein
VATAGAAGGPGGGPRHQPPAAGRQPDAQAEMFERYKDILHKQELQQAAEAAQATRAT